MRKHCISLFIVLCSIAVQSQTAPTDSLNSTKQDSIKRKAFITNIGNGYFPTKYFNFDLRYLVKFNQYEGFRTGMGAVTNDAFSSRYRATGYLSYGFRDDRWKYSIGGGTRVRPRSNTWINVAYTDDLQETGSSTFLTDKRFFQLFQPRLLNIDLFHRLINRTISLEHRISPRLLTEIQLASTDVLPTYGYSFVVDDKAYHDFDLTTSIVSLQWSPFSRYEYVDDKLRELKKGFPQFTLQYTQSYKNIFDGNFNFLKLDFRSIYQIVYPNASETKFTLRAGIAKGKAPLTHLYHTYPNNITKETILQRFSVAGLNSFETMYFNEFFSDRFTTFQIKHFFKPFKITERYQPQLVLITRYALGDMDHIERHQNVTFGTLDKGYTESGLEINKLLFGFGLSFAYRYGAYHLPREEDNIAVKFTFNLTL
ncbi:hypothetical protein [Mangrovimonas sp. DI 80]|uniref:hypothetical protein n=1 Tax=Mangrovimonas sp. DI 80 TaxID=1779330 RepID=UPI00097710C2|nr:hypothetical protein [Mangrovimonas sp. DI 80]OMP31961.1 hypothetical protein BKM32_02580 [Mangrovimonas sp. DI 80]